MGIRVTNRQNTPLENKVMVVAKILGGIALAIVAILAFNFIGWIFG